MKTIEQKAKAYDEALERAKKLQETCDSTAVLGWCEYIFPELKESEDEKIRKTLMAFFRDWERTKSHCWNVNVSDILAWLEKQCEQKPYGQRKECEDCQFNYAGECKCSCTLKRNEHKPTDKVEPKFKVGDTMRTLQEAANGYTDGMPVVVSIDNEYYHCTNELIAIKDQDDYEFPPINVKQKSSDKVEPKFHHGDWIIDNEYGEVLKVTKSYANSYEITNQDGEVFDILKEDVECNHRLWTFEDAKDGDELVASDGSIFLFAGVDDCACKYYVALTTDNYLKINKEPKGEYWETSRAVHPATKEQRDLLSQKMADAGYEFVNGHLARF